MTTIDAHQHFWWYGRRNHRWPETVGSRLDRDFTPEDLRQEMDRAGIGGTILMQSLNDADETTELLHLADDMSPVLGVVGWVPLTRPDATEKALDALPRTGKLVGIRHLINFEPDPRWLLLPAVQDSVGVIASRRLVFDTVPNDPVRFEAVLETAARHPGMRVVIDHLGRPPVVEAGWEPWASLISQAAALPNVSIKLSVGLDVVAGWTWSAAGLQRYVDHALACFGPSRVMAASNWPVSTLAGGYGAIWSGLRLLIAGLAAHEREMVLGGTARTLFGLADRGGDR